MRSAFDKIDRKSAAVLNPLLSSTLLVRGASDKALTSTVPNRTKSESATHPHFELTRTVASDRQVGSLRVLQANAQHSPGKRRDFLDPS